MQNGYVFLAGGLYSIFHRLNYSRSPLCAVLYQNSIRPVIALNPESSLLIRKSCPYVAKPDTVHGDVNVAIYIPPFIC